MGQAEPQKTYYTFEEYLKLEQMDNVRYEYYHGEVFAMAGGTQDHNTIAQNCIVLFSQSLSDDCRSFIGDLKVEIHSKHHYLYPDVVVTCDPDDIQGTKTMVNSPTLIIEVLSKSTKHYDKDEKKQAYFRLPSLEYYILVAQDKVEVEVYARHKDFWANKTYTDASQAIELPKLNMALEVTEIYKRVDLA